MDGPVQRVIRDVSRTLWLAATVWCAGPVAMAQHEQPTIRPQGQAESVQTPDLAEPVLKLLDASYLTDDERKDLRIFHGVWKEGDLDTPQRRARAALIRGTIDDAALAEAAVSAEDRAEAAMLRGELERAVTF